MRKSAPLATKPLGKPVRKSPQHKATQKIKNKISIQRTITTARVIAPTLSHITRNPIQNTLQRPQQLPQLKQLPQQQSSAFTTSTIISLPSFNSHSSTTKPSLPLFSTQYARISTFSNTNNHNNNNLTIPTTKIPHQHKQTKLIKSSMGFKKTTPTRFVGRILMAAGLVALLIGSRYVASGLSAFHNAYKNTSNLVKPIDDGEVLEAQHELSLAAQEVNDMAEVEENERRIKKQKQEELKSRREREARKAKAGLGPANIIQDDFSDHIDIAAREKKKKLEIEAELHAMRFDSNDAEIDMNTTFYNLELVLRGDGAGFEPTMSVIEAEKILVCLRLFCFYFSIISLLFFRSYPYPYPSSLYSSFQTRYCTPSPL